MSRPISSTRNRTSGFARSPTATSKWASPTTHKARDSFGVVESVRAASDVYTPVAGSVVEGNAPLGSQPELINSEPYGAGWIMRLTPGSAPAGLLSAAEYQAHLDAEG